MARRRRPTCAAPAAFASSNGVFTPETWDPDGAASLPKLYEALPRRHLWHHLCASKVNGHPVLLSEIRFGAQATTSEKGVRHKLLT